MKPKGFYLDRVPFCRYHDPVMLLFKKKFLEQIKCGEKTQTIRLWHHCRMRSGQRSYVPGVGYISIESVESVELARLTDADAELDGFPSADLLRREIHTLYAADTRKELIPFKIRFSVYPPREQQRMSKERQIQKQMEKQKQEQRKNLRQHSDVRRRESVALSLDKLLKMSEADPGQE